MDIGYDRPLYILPFDHRASFEKGLFGFSEVGPDRELWEYAELVTSLCMDAIPIRRSKLSGESFQNRLRKKRADAITEIHAQRRWAGRSGGRPAPKLKPF
jgi:hypothetical protein